jgi:hypothetical protein
VLAVVVAAVGTAVMSTGASGLDVEGKDLLKNIRPIVMSLLNIVVIADHHTVMLECW